MFDNLYIIIWILDYIHIWDIDFCLFYFDKGLWWFVRMYVTYMYVISKTSYEYTYDA